MVQYESGIVWMGPKIYCESDTVDNVVKRANSKLRKMKKARCQQTFDKYKTNYILLNSPHKPSPPSTFIKLSKKHVTRVIYVSF